MSTYLILTPRIQEYWVSPPKPQLIGYFVEPRFRSEKTTFSDEQNVLGSLKYYNNRVDLSSDNLFSTFKEKADTLKREESFLLLKPLEEWISKRIEMDAVRRAKFVTDRETLASILQTPLGSLGWTLTLKYINEKYYMWANDRVKPCDKLSFLEAVKLSLFKNMPNTHSLDTIGKKDLFFNEVYEIQVGDRSIIYSAEIPGVSSDKVVNNIEELRTATHIDTAVCSNPETPANCLTCNRSWTRAVLIAAERVILACSKHGYPSRFCQSARSCVFHQTTVDELIATDRNQSLGAPQSSWNILDDFLAFIEREVDSDAGSSTATYEFEFKRDSSISYRKITVA